MSNATSKLFALALAGACALGVWKLGDALLSSDEAQGTEHLTNQVWIDRVPQDHRDMITHLVVLEHRQGKFGAVGNSSAWRHIAEVFKWKLRGNELEFYFPQDSVRGKIGVRTWSCEGEAPEPFELCLELINPQGGTAMLYSREDWKVRPHDMSDSIADIVDDYPQLAGVLEGLDDDQVEQLEALELDDQRWREGASLLRR